MSKCEWKKDGTVRVAVLFGVAGLGALIALVLGSVFFWKWLLCDQHRRKRIPVLVSSIVGVFTLQHGLRFTVVILDYTAPRWAASLVFHATSLCLVAMFNLLFVLMVEQLKMTFKHTSQAVSKKQSTMLHCLIAIDTAGLICHQIISDLIHTGNHPTYALRGALLALTAVLLILGLTILISVDSCYIRRIQSVVARRASLDSPDLSGAIATEKPPKSRMIIRVPTLSEIRRSSNAQFDVLDQDLLKHAARAVVIAVWISVGFCVVGVAAVCLALSNCANDYSIATYALSALVYPLIVVPVSFTLPTLQPEYETCCFHCNSFVTTLVEIETRKETLHLSQLQS